MPNLMVALPNTGGALCSTPQSLAYRATINKSSRLYLISEFDYVRIISYFDVGQLVLFQNSLQVTILNEIQQNIIENY